MVMSQTINPADQLETASDSLRDAEHAYNAALRDFKTKTTSTAASQSEDVRKSLQDLYAPDLRAAEAAAIKAANDATATAQSLLARGQTPRIAIDPDDEIRAGASYERIRDRVRTLPFEALAESVRAAIEAGDRATMLNFYETLLSRLDADASALSPREKEARFELRSLRSKILDRMRDRSFEAYAGDATELSQRASDLRKIAGRFNRENAPKRVYSFQKPGDIRNDDFE